MKTAFHFPAPAPLDVDHLRAHLVEADLPTWELYLDDKDVIVVFPSPDDVTPAAIASLRSAMASYKPRRVRYTFPRPQRFDLGVLIGLIAALGLDGFTGLTFEGDEVHAEFPFRSEPLPEADAARLAEVFATYVYIPTVESVQRERAAAYPSIGDQLDAIWKGGEEMEAMRARVMQVKVDHPKPQA